MTKCLISGAETETFLSFGKMPIANGFLTPEQYGTEYFFELKVGYCPESGMVQLTELVQQEKMFHENYAFFSSTSLRMAEHFQRLRGIRARVARRLRGPVRRRDRQQRRHHAAELREGGRAPPRHRALGQRRRRRPRQGHQHDLQVLRRNAREEIVPTHGQADAFMGANVMCHIPYMHSVVAGIKLLLKPKGVLIFEDPYLGDIIQKTSYDQIYDEHAFYFSGYLYITTHNNNTYLGTHTHTHISWPGGGGGWWSQ